IGRQQIDADDVRLRQALAHHLGPAARRDAEIDDLARALEEAEPLVQLDQLVGGTAAIALRLGALHIGIVELPFEPARRADPPAPGRADPRPGAAARPAHIAWPSLAISARNMPSRMPRSAMPSVSAGQMSMIAPRIAQPATTRSARSWPMQGNFARSSWVDPDSNRLISRIAAVGTISPSIALRS